VFNGAISLLHQYQKQSCISIPEFQKKMLLADSVVIYFEPTF
jgi:hypothetical protein